MSLAQLTIPLGIAAFASLLFTAFSGLAMYKFHLPWVNMRWHIWGASATVIFAAGHVLVVVFFY